MRSLPSEARKGGCVIATAFSVSWADQRMLAFVSRLKSARLTGSFARGCPRNDSDMDFRVNDKDLRAVIEECKRQGVPWDSALPGHVTADGMEFYTGFNRIPRSTRADSVSINGVWFRTA